MPIIATDPELPAYERPRYSTRVPEVVTPSPAVPPKADALTLFKEDPAALRDSALTALSLKLPAVIQDQGTAAEWADRLSQIRTLSKNIEARRKTVVEPLNKQVKDVNAEAHRWADPLEALEQKIQAALGAFMRLDADRKRREEEARQSALRDAAQKQLQAEAMQNPVAIEAASVAIAALETEAAPKPVTGFRTEAGSVHTRKRWTVEVVHPEEVPPNYLVPDLKALQAAVDAGARTIPGCHIEETELLTVRTR